MSEPDLFTVLRGLLARHAGSLAVVHDTPDHFYANTTQPDAKGRPVFFGAVKRSGKKVVVHLMPVYEHPPLLDALSPALRQRMQGKSCFNFVRHDPALFTEMQALVDRSTAHWQSQGKL